MRIPKFSLMNYIANQCLSQPRNIEEAALVMYETFTIVLLTAAVWVAIFAAVAVIPNERPH
jgi:hypothetical protein